jgi:hypothetical protein
MPLFVSVTPGTTVTNSTTLDATTLNLLGTPSVDVTGTVDGGSLSLSAGSVGTNELAANAVTFAKMQTVTANRLLGNDGTGTAIEEITPNTTNFEFGSGTFALKNRGVSEAKLFEVTTKKLLGRNATTDGDVQQITVGTGLALSDAGTLSVSASFVKFSNNSSLTVPKSTSPTPWQSKIEHNLSGTPSLLRVYALWNGASASVGGFILGQQVTIESLFAFDYRPAFTCWADSTYIYLSRASYSGAPILCTPSTGGNYVDLTSEFDSASSNWTFAVEAVRFT